MARRQTYRFRIQNQNCKQDTQSRPIGTIQGAGRQEQNWNRSRTRTGTEAEQKQNRSRTEAEQKQNRTGTEPEQNWNRTGTEQNSFLQYLTPAKENKEDDKVPVDGANLLNSFQNVSASANVSHGGTDDDGKTENNSGQQNPACPHDASPSEHEGITASANVNDVNTEIEGTGQYNPANAQPGSSSNKRGNPNDVVVSASEKESSPQKKNVHWIGLQPASSRIIT